MKTQRDRGEKSSENNFRQQITLIRHPDIRRRSCDQSKEHAKKNGLTGTANSSFIVAREHAKSGLRVIATTKPGDSEEVRDLPDEDDREQSPGSEIERVARCRPPNQRRKRAWDCANQRVGGGNALQRGVSKDVNDDGERGQKGREKICGEGEIND